jgi:hypothetical protein
MQDIVIYELIFEGDKQSWSILHHLCLRGCMIDLHYLDLSLKTKGKTADRTNIFHHCVGYFALQFTIDPHEVVCRNSTPRRPPLGIRSAEMLLLMMKAYCSADE